jgi:hypothetical protein
MNQHAVVGKFSLEIVSPADFKTVDMPPATAKAPRPAPWK